MPLPAGKKNRIKSAGIVSSNSYNPSNISLSKSLFSDDRKRKFFDTLKFLIIAAPPISAVFLLSILMIIQIDQTLRTDGTLNEYLSQSQLINKLIASLQKERGMTCLLLTSTSGTNVFDSQLALLRGDTDNALKEFGDAQWSTLIHSANMTDMTTLDAFSFSLANFRKSVTHKTTSTSSCMDTISYYTPCINILIFNAGRVFYDSDDGKFWGTFDALRMVLYAEEMFGLTRAAGGAFFSQGYSSPDLLYLFMNVYSSAQRFLDQAGQTDADVNNFLAKQIRTINDTMTYMQILVDDILNNRTAFDQEEKSLSWFYNITNFSTTVVASTSSMLSTKLGTSLVAKLFSARSSLYVYLAIVGLSLIVCIPITLYYSYQARRMQAKVKEKIYELGIEKKRSENLLYQMLPKEVVHDLQNGKMIAPRMYRECTIYFSDIVGFTTICSTSTPIEIVELLNMLYTAMDTVLDQYNVYKVETIGDAYMVVSGIPSENHHDHSCQIATMALHMLKEISSMVVPHRRNERLRMRIGCNTGPCAAGVVGLKMPRYCLFGDTVNTASRMESTGKEMRIQLTEVTHDHIVKYHKKEEFSFVPRGVNEIKGKGSMMTYWLKSKKTFPFICEIEEEESQ